ncbi:MAG: hypothetical protein ACI8W8_003211 [Rhodothermales bacterium]|jgi:hypothetical protein
MLTELKRCRQITGEPARRCFSDREFDLIFWYNADDSVYGLQLCYDKAKYERTLTWIADSGFAHHGIDTGKICGRPPDRLTPILVPDGYFDAEKVRERFLIQSVDLPQEIIALVVARLEEYGRC